MDRAELMVWLNGVPGECRPPWKALHGAEQYRALWYSQGCTDITDSPYGKELALHGEMVTRQRDPPLPLPPQPPPLMLKKDEKYI